MKTYTIDYRYALGSFLDWREIKWNSSNENTSVTFHLESDEQFAKLILDYAEWVEDIEAL